MSRYKTLDGFITKDFAEKEIYNECSEYLSRQGHGNQPFNERFRSTPAKANESKN